MQLHIQQVSIKPEFKGINYSDPATFIRALALDILKNRISGQVSPSRFLMKRAL